MSGALVLLHPGRESMTARNLATRLGRDHQVIDVGICGELLDVDEPIPSLPPADELAEMTIVACGSAAWPALVLASRRGCQVSKLAMFGPTLPRQRPDLSGLAATSTPALVVTTVASRACRSHRTLLGSVLKEVEFCRLPYPSLTWSPRVSNMAADIIEAYVR
jgi:hypothetical protein